MERGTANGEYIWRYQGRKIGITKYSSFFIVGDLILAFLFILGFPVLSLKLMRMGIDRDLVEWGMMIAIGLLIAIFIKLNRDAVRNSEGNSHSFARDDENHLYIFNYNDPIYDVFLESLGEYVEVGIGKRQYHILHRNKTSSRVARQVEKAKILEKALKNKKMKPYGQKITGVLSLLERGKSLEICCVLDNDKQVAYFIPKDYNNYEGLLQALQKLQIRHGNDSEKYESSRKFWYGSRW